MWTQLAGWLLATNTVQHVGGRRLANVVENNDDGLLQRLRSWGWAAEASPSLAVLVRTGGPQSESRMKSVTETWGGDIEKGKFVTMQSNQHCKEKYGDNHQKGLTCLEAASDLQLMNRTDFDWLLVVDDDVYVFVDRVRDTLNNVKASDARVYGVPGCGDCAGGKHGFCGGGGYILSRQSLLKMAASTSAPVSQEAGTAFLEHMMKNRGSDWADVSFGCVAMEKGLELESVQGMFGNPVQDSKGKYDQAQEVSMVESSEVPALVFHRVSDASHMHHLHQESRDSKKRGFASLAAWRKQ